MLAQLRDEFSVAWDLARFGRHLYRNAEYLAATVEVDPQAMRPWLPAGVKLAEPARADLFCAWFPDNAFGVAYREVGLFVHVKVGRKTGIHCPWMLVDNDIALILGREALGYPKKMADITWTRENDRIVAGGTRQGVTLVEMTATLGKVIDDPPPFLGRPHRNVVGMLGVSLPRLIAFTPRETNVETREVRLDLRFAGSTRDPLHEMGLGAVVEARLHRVNIAAGWLPPLSWRPTNPLYLMRRLQPRVL